MARKYSSASTINKMEEPKMTQSNDFNKNNTDEAEDVEKVLTVVVKRRKTIPKKYMELYEQISTFELLRLENAKVVLPEDSEKENLKRVVERLKKLRTLKCPLEDLQEAERKLKRYHKRAKEINTYLEKRRRSV